MHDRLAWQACLIAGKNRTEARKWRRNPIPGSVTHLSPGDPGWSRTGPRPGLVMDLILFVGGKKVPFYPPLSTLSLGVQSRL